MRCETPTIAIVGYAVGEHQQHVAVERCCRTPADEIEVAQLVQRCHQLGLIADPRAILRDRARWRWDVTGDGRPDVITGAGPNGGPHVGVFDGTTLKNVKSFFAFADTFRGGVSVSAGDVNGDGRADIVTGNGSTGEVQVYDGVSLASLRRIAGSTSRGTPSCRWVSTRRSGT